MKFAILRHEDLSQIQMWLNQYNTTKGGVVVQSPLFFDGTLYIITISHNI